MKEERIADVRIGGYLASDVMTCVGKKAVVYLGKFDRLHEKGYSFNWCAALFTALWFAYRKMWKASAAIMGFNVIYTMVLTFLEKKILSFYNAPVFTGAAVGLFVISMALFGLLGDRLYWRHVSAILDEQGCRDRSAVEKAALRESLRKAGGTSVIGVIILWIASLVLQWGVSWFAMTDNFIQPIPDTVSGIDGTFKIDLPDKLGFTPYVSPDIAGKDEFEHSEYLLMVRASRHSFTGEKIPLFSYAFLGGNTNSFEDGSEIYNKLDSIYSKQYPYSDLPEAYIHNLDDEQVETLKDYFFKRSVIFVSGDGKRVLLQSRLFGGMLKRTGYGDTVVEREAWNRLLEIYDGKKSIYEKMYKDDNPYQSAPYINDFFINGSVFDLNGFMIDHDIIINYIEKTEKYIIEDGSDVLHIPNATNKFLKSDLGQDQISIYSLLDGKRLASINIPSYLEISQMTNDERIVVLFPLRIPNEGDDIEEFYKENVYTNDTYIMNIDGSDAQYLGDYMFSPCISPDGKYIAYTGMTGTDHQEYSNEFNKLADMKDGFYIKNVETNQTIFYPVEGTYEYNIVGWVSKKGLEKLFN